MYRQFCELKKGVFLSHFVACSYFMDNSIVDFNVGGTTYSTTVQTIERYPQAYLNKILKDKTALIDKHNRIFVDRDGPLFRYILDFYRYGGTSIPRNLDELDRLREEAVFYELDDMVECIDDLITTGHMRKQSVSCITVGYRGTFSSARDSSNDLRFRKLARILVAGQTAECRQVFGDYLNDTRDPDTGSSYSSRFFLKHTILENAFDTLYSHGYDLVACCASGTNGSDTDIKFGQDAEEVRWQHYNEFVFVKKVPIHVIGDSKEDDKPGTDL